MTDRTSHKKVPVDVDAIQRALEAWLEEKATALMPQHQACERVHAESEVLRASRTEGERLPLTTIHGTTSLLARSIGAFDSGAHLQLCSAARGIRRSGRVQGPADIGAVDGRGGGCGGHGGSRGWEKVKLVEEESLRLK